MDYRKFDNTYIIRLDPGEEVIAQLKALCETEGITLANVTGHGASADFTVGIFDANAKQFVPNNYTEAAEIVSLVGTITTMNDAFYAHLHMGAGFIDGRMVGGHMSRAVISLTSEIVLTAINGRVDRAFSPEIGLNLLKFD